MPADFKMNFKYKGDRRYVQGGDIYSTALSILKKRENDYPTRIDWTFHSFLIGQGLMKVYSNVKFVPEFENAKARFTVVYNNKLLKGVVLERSEGIDLSTDYDEGDVLSGYKLEGKTITMRFKKRYSYIEQIIAMTKFLHHTIYPDTQNKWLFTKLSLNSFIDPKSYEGMVLEVKADKNFGGRLTQNLINVGQKNAGKIFFSELK